MQKYIFSSQNNRKLRINLKYASSKYNFLNKKWFFDKVYSEYIGQFFFKFGYTTSYKIIDRGIIEIIPLAYMRGRTINRSAMILDEAQNASSIQMKMFLTRLGIESRAIITGDASQIDLDFWPC